MRRQARIIALVTHAPPRPGTATTPDLIGGETADPAPFQPSATGGTGRDSIQTTSGQHDRRNMRIGGHRLQPSIAIGSERHTRYAGPVRALHAVVALRCACRAGVCVFDPRLSGERGHRAFSSGVLGSVPRRPRRFGTSIIFINFNIGPHAALA